MNKNHIIAGEPILRFDRFAVSLHWIVFVLVALAYLAIEIRGPKGTDSRVFWSGIHYVAGLLVLVLAIVRSGWRLRHAPPPVTDAAVWAHALAKAVHVLLYAFILIQPILGILTLNLGGHPVTIIGTNLSFTVVGENPDMKALVKATHELMGNVFYYIIGLHILAALFHHFVLRDATIRRML
jgi:cytochrome b561